MRFLVTALVLTLLLVGGVAEAGLLKGKRSNFGKFNDPKWGSNWKQALSNRQVNFSPYVRSY